MAPAQPQIKEAAWAEGTPDADNETRFWQVGKPADWKHRDVLVTRITVQHDLPGLHGDLWRVCVWVGNALVAEAPLHNIQAVGYEVPTAS